MAVPPARSNRKLATYRAKRDFSITPEPGAQTPRETEAHPLSFAVQKHAASHLHYDFRLEWQGVLKSWAVPKGPSYDPAQKRLAIEVEDHPLAYGGFEGTIPAGQYGGGEVILWDRGTWEPLDSAEQGFRQGKLKFVLHGEKLKGAWMLIRLPDGKARGGKTQWLLRKEHDGLEHGPEDTPITEQSPDSVLNGARKARDAVRTSAKSISRSQPRNSSPTNSAEAKTLRAPAARRSKADNVRLNGAPVEALPSFIEPQLAFLSSKSVHGDEWIHELKLDGYRIQARIESTPTEAVKLLTRTAQDWTDRMPSIARALEALPVRSALCDGEVVVFSQNGQTNFADLQAAFSTGDTQQLTYVVFDLLHLNGRNLRSLPLVERKQLLEQALAASPAGGAIRFSAHLGGSGETIFSKACEIGAEGIISKRACGPYVSGRSRDWLKRKCHQEQEFVIGGFTLPTNGSYGVGALLLGYYEKNRLIYAGRTGTGFTQKLHRSVRDRLEALRTSKMPFTSRPASAGRGVIWVKPDLVAQVTFANWTADKIVRQAAFKGLREDKPARVVGREEAETNHMSETTTPAKTKHEAKSSPAAAPALPIRLTHPDKVLEAESGLTKEELARYYLAVTPRMWPYIKGRPISLVRCQGTGLKSCFFQRHLSGTLPRGFEGVAITERKTGKDEYYLALSSPESIVELAQIDVLEIHAWGAQSSSPDRPDQIVIDLDPDVEIDWKAIAAAALDVKKRMEAMGLVPFLKSTGGKGLHLVAPIVPEHDWPTVKDAAHRLTLEMEKENPSLYLTRMTKAARKGKIYLDYLRNDRGATAVVPFSPRARAGAAVAMPLAWAELKKSSRTTFTVRNIDQWSAMRDPWAGFHDSARRLSL